MKDYTKRLNAIEQALAGPDVYATVFVGEGETFDSPRVQAQAQGLSRTGFTVLRVKLLRDPELYG
jgi:hypothetical protein